MALAMQRFTGCMKARLGPQRLAGGWWRGESWADTVKSGRSTGTPTKAEAARFDAIKELGCILGHKLDLGWVPAEIHHLTIGGKHGAKRRGHEFSIGLNPWSHRGVTFNGLTQDQCMEMFGPSYAKQPRSFRQLIGNDDELLEYQNQLLGEGYEQD